MTTPAEHITHLLGGAKFSTRPGPHAGGEWDAWKQLPLRTRRRIIGAGWAGRNGWAPDQLAHILGDRLTPCELVDELERAAKSLTAWRSQREQAARQRLARRLHGPTATYHTHREQVAAANGHRSYRDYRRSKGWPG